jgi:hypothetical protein
VHDQSLKAHDCSLSYNGQGLSEALSGVSTVRCLRVSTFHSGQTLVLGKDPADSALLAGWWWEDTRGAQSDLSRGATSHSSVD